jgi:hypothetical protein
VQAIGKALAVNKTLMELDLGYSEIGTNGARKVGQALQVNRALHLDGRNALVWEIDKLVAVKRDLDAKLLAVIMSMHACIRAESGLKILEDHLVTLICDLLCRDSKTSSLFGKAGVFACPGNHHLETGAVADETPLAQAFCDVCLKTLPVGTQEFSCRVCDWDGCPDCRNGAQI